MNKKNPLPQEKINKSKVNKPNYVTLPLNTDATLKSINTNAGQSPKSPQAVEDSWQDWWEIKMKRNIELIKQIKSHNLEKVKDLIDEQKYLDMAADVNY